MLKLTWSLITGQVSSIFWKSLCMLIITGIVVVPLTPSKCLVLGSSMPSQSSMMSLPQGRPCGIYWSTSSRLQAPCKGFSYPFFLACFWSIPLIEWPSSRECRSSLPTIYVERGLVMICTWHVGCCMMALDTSSCSRVNMNSYMSKFNIVGYWWIFSIAANILNLVLYRTSAEIQVSQFYICVSSSHLSWPPSPWQNVSCFSQTAGCVYWIIFLESVYWYPI